MSNYTQTEVKEYAPDELFIVRSGKKNLATVEYTAASGINRTQANEIANVIARTLSKPQRPIVSVYNSLNEHTTITHFEVHPLKNVSKQESPFYDHCEEKDADVWGVFAHIPDMGLESIIDFYTKAEAQEFATTLENIGLNFMR